MAAVVTVLRPKIAYNTAWSLHSVFAGTIHVYSVLKHKTTYLKLLSLSLSPLPLFSHTYKLQLLKYDWSCSFWLPLEHADDILLYYSNVHRNVCVNRCPRSTMYTHVGAKFIRSMSQSVTGSDLIGLLKSYSVSRALNQCGFVRHTA